MSKAVVCTGRIEEFRGDTEVTDVTIADGVTAIKQWAFHGGQGLPCLRVLAGSAIMTVGSHAFRE
jgi:hypothetical protein